MTGDRRAALQAIHFPETWEALKAARQHLVLSEFFGLQMLIAARRAESTGRKGGMHCGSGELLDRFVKALPFGLTKAQEKVVTEIDRPGREISDEPFAAGRRGLGQDGGRDCGHSPGGGSGISGGAHGPDANSGRTTLRGFAAMAQAARSPPRSAHGRAAGGRRAAAVVRECGGALGPAPPG